MKAIHLNFAANLS